MIKYHEGKAHGPLTPKQADQLRRHLLMWRAEGTRVEVDWITGRWRRWLP